MNLYMQLQAARGCVARLLADAWLSAAAVALFPSSAADDDDDVRVRC